MPGGNNGKCYHCAMLRNAILTWTVLLLSASACAHEIAVQEPSSDEANFGEAEDQLTWNFEQKVAGYRNMDKITWTRAVPAGSSPFPLAKNEADLDSLAFKFDERDLTVDEFVQQQHVAGLIVVKDGAIVYERYELGNTAETRWISYSVAKSVTSLLVGAALHDGYIDSVEEKVSDYIPKLRDSAYAQTSIRNALQMASGVAWNEDYTDPESDISQNALEHTGCDGVSE